MVDSPKGWCQAIIVLVRPEIPENIGFIARSLACYGWPDLRIVGTLPDAKSPAWKTVSGGESVLHNAQAFSSLAEAVADCHAALGFSRRPNREGVSLDLPQAMQRYANGHLGGVDSRIALVFGPESQGLQAKDGDSLTQWVVIPTAHPTMSLNLSHAVTVALHAFSEAGVRLTLRDGVGLGVATDLGESGDKPASMALLARGWDMVLQGLQEKEAYPPAKAKAQFSYLHSLWNRMRLSQREAEFLIGSLKKWMG